MSEKKKTLGEEDLVVDRAMSRRSSMAVLGASVLGAVALATGLTPSTGFTRRDALKLARDIAVKNAGKLAKSRYDRNLDDLDEHLRNGQKILIDITAAQRNILDQKITTGQVSKAESKIFGVVKPDEEHILWPFDGEYWRDELGFYRQVVESACGR